MCQGLTSIHIPPVSDHKTCPFPTHRGAYHSAMGPTSVRHGPRNTRLTVSDGDPQSSLEKVVDDRSSTDLFPPSTIRCACDVLCCHDRHPAHLHRHDLGIPVAAALQELLVQLLLQGLKPLLLLLQGLFRVLLHLRSPKGQGARARRTHARTPCLRGPTAQRFAGGGPPKAVPLLVLHCRPGQRWWLPSGGAPGNSTVVVRSWAIRAGGDKFASAQFRKGGIPGILKLQTRCYFRLGSGWLLLFPGGLWWARRENFAGGGEIWQLFLTATFSPRNSPLPKPPPPPPNCRSTMVVTLQNHSGHSNSNSCITRRSRNTHSSYCPARRRHDSVIGLGSSPCLWAASG